MVAIYIPENKHSIPARWFTLDDLAQLLRENCNDSDAISFIADMIEDGLGSVANKSGEE